MLNLLRLLGRRLLALPVMVLGVTFLAFFIMSFSTADPARLALGESASEAALQDWRATRNLDDPLLLRFWRYLLDLLQGNLGSSFQGESVNAMVASNFPITLQLTFLGLIIAVVLSLALGITAAIFRDKWPDQLIRFISIAFLAMPSFWLALLLIQAFGNVPGGAGWFPAIVTDWVPLSSDSAAYLRQITLPALSLGFPVSGSLTRVVRTAMVEELDKDYVRTAIGAGVPKSIVIARNVLRNALITPITVLGLRVGYLLGGAVVIERIFNIQGMGQLIFQGITRNDIPIVLGVTITVALAFVLVNLVVDLLYVLVNPRIRSI